MELSLRIFLFGASFLALLLIITKIKQSKIKINSSIIWIALCILFMLMSIFDKIIIKFSNFMGFVSPASFIFTILIAFLFIHAFYSTIAITILNNKIKNLNHAIALKESEKNTK